MGRSYNSLKASDITTTPVKLKYSASYYSSDFGPGAINVITGSNGSTSPTGSYSDSFLLYRSMRNRFYMQYLSGSLLGSASAYEWFPQSTAATGTNDDDNRFFPTDSDSIINVITVPKSNFGENIAKGSFKIQVTSSIFNTVDDGNGNLVAENNRTTHVGNIFYNQGLAVITNPIYQGMFSTPYIPPFIYPSGLIAAFDPDINVTVDGLNRVTKWGDNSGHPISDLVTGSTAPGTVGLLPQLQVGLVNGQTVIDLPEYGSGQTGLGFVTTIPFNTYLPYSTGITLIFVSYIPFYPTASPNNVRFYYDLEGVTSGGTPNFTFYGAYSKPTAYPSGDYQLYDAFIDRRSTPITGEFLEYKQPAGSAGVLTPGQPFVTVKTLSYGNKNLLNASVNSTTIPISPSYPPTGPNPYYNNLSSSLNLGIGQVASSGYHSAGGAVYFGEILMWGRALNSTEIATVQAYLISKYSIV